MAVPVSESMMIMCTKSVMSGAITSGLVLHPAWGEPRADRITAGVEPVPGQAMLIHHFGMGIEHIAEGIAGPEDLDNGVE